MTIFIGADHRGFELKNALVDFIQTKDIRVEDLGNYEYDDQDDYPDYAQKVAQAVLQNPSENLGIVICGSGIGVSVAVNRYKGIMCALGFDPTQVKHGRERDHVNILALPSDHIDEETAQSLVEAFINAKPLNTEKDLRRISKVDSV